jgi:hypothetical protein
MESPDDRGRDHPGLEADAPKMWRIIGGRAVRALLKVMEWPPCSSGVGTTDCYRAASSACEVIEACLAVTPER